MLSRRASLIGFFALAYGLTWLCWLSIGAASAGWIRLPVARGTLATLGQFGPFISALLFTGLEEGKMGLRDLLRRLVLWRVSAAALAASVLFPPAALLAAAGAHALLSGRAPVFPRAGGPEAIAVSFVYILLVGGPLGEEPGWRGFALPRLQERWSPAAASLFLGLAWAGWHLPLWWIASIPGPYGLYVVGIIPLTFLFTCATNRARGSVLVPLLFHAALNTASLRIPLAPVFAEWTALLWIAALVVFLRAPDRYLKSPSVAGVPVPAAA